MFSLDEKWRDEDLPPGNRPIMPTRLGIETEFLMMGEAVAHTPPGCEKNGSDKSSFADGRFEACIKHLWMRHNAWMSFTRDNEAGFWPDETFL